MSDTVTAYHNNVAALSVCASIIFVISLPIYGYGIFKFWQFRQHLLIQKRFPLLSISIILTSFLNGSISCFLIWIHYITNSRELFAGYNTPELGAGLSYFVYGLVNLRLSLVYLRCKNYQTNYKRKRIYLHWSFISLLILTVIGFCYISFASIHTEEYQILIGMLWSIQMVITGILISIVVCKKVKDGIGCLRETISNLCFVLIIALMFPLTFMSNKLFLPLFILFNIGAYIQGLFPLYGGLYYVHKMEGTLDQQNVEQTKNMEINIQNDVGEIPLFVFMEKYENYKIFKEYLAYCWAVENLLFFENISIINQIILKYKQYSSDHVDNEENGEMMIYRNKFIYLTEIYEQYESEIGNLDKTKHDIQFDDIKMKLFKIYQKIYQRFIEPGSMNEVNLSFKIRNSLSLLLINDENINRFKTIDDFLHLFDGAMSAVHQLILSVYRYNFKQYMQMHHHYNSDTL